MQQTPTSDQDALGDDRHALLQAYGTDLLDAVPAGIIVLNEADRKSTRLNSSH